MIQCTKIVAKFKYLKSDLKLDTGNLAKAEQGVILTAATTTAAAVANDMIINLCVENDDKKLLQL